jgi:hypothetical protein
MYGRHILCTLYGAVDFLIVPSKGLYGWGGGGRSRAIEFLYAPEWPEQFLYIPVPLSPTVWALKPPLWALHLLGLSLYMCMHT